MTKTILIAEDNPANMKLLKDILTFQNYTVIEAVDGEEVIYLSLKHNKEINLILMDLQLPKITGLDAIKQIKLTELTKDIPIFVVSAYAMENDISKAKHLGCEDYITKPINIADFLKKIKLYLG